MELSGVQARYLGKAKVAANLFLLKSEDALDYIDECVAAGYTLQGVEGFTITNEGDFQPHMEYSNDIIDSDSNNVVQVTKAFIQKNTHITIRYEVIFS